MKIHGLLYDLARRQRADEKNLRRVVDRLAELDYNMMAINLENYFEFPSCPGIAAEGAMTVEMARRLVEYGGQRGVHIVAQPNVIEHCEGIGATERYAHLTAAPYSQEPRSGYRQLNLALPETRELVKKMINDVLQAFPGEYLHIGCDEVRHMADIYPDDKQRQVREMIEFFNYVLDLGLASKREIIMWGDMPLHHNELMESLPREIIIADWHYGPLGRRESLERYKAEGFRVVACPSVSTYRTVGTAADTSAQNITRMVGDAVDLDLEGFLLTTWEFGFGSGTDLIWPWVGMAADIAAGQVSDPTGDDGESYVSAFAAQRYGIDGTSYIQLHNLLNLNVRHARIAASQRAEKTYGQLAELLDQRLQTALKQSGLAWEDCYRSFRMSDGSAITALRKTLFRGAYPSLQVWEPSPFQPWLYLRPILTEDVLAALAAIDNDIQQLVNEIEGRAASNADELVCLLSLGRAFHILVERLRTLERAHAAYHQAAEAQGVNPTAFAASLAQVTRELAAIGPQIHSLREIVGEIDRVTGLEPDEFRWLDIQDKSLAEHIAALQNWDPAQTLLEFGEFLRRPAHVTQRIAWGDR